MIKTLSNYTVEVPFKNPTTNIVASSYVFKIYVWSGTVGAIPEVASYQITKPNPLFTDGSDFLNISRIINSFVNFDLVLTQATPGTMYVQYTITYSDTPLVETVLLSTFAVKGYGYSSEGANPQLPSNKNLIIGDEFYVGRNSLFCLPIIATVGVVNVTVYPSAVMTQTVISEPTDNTEILQNIFINIAAIPASEEFIEVVYNGVTTTLLITDECRYTPIDIAFQNSHGALQIITFFKAITEKLSVTKETYQSINGTRAYNVNSKSKFSVNSGFVKEDKNKVFRELLLAEKCWRIDNFVATPLTLSTKDFSYKTRVNDKLINYEIDFEYANNDINKG